MRKHLVFLMCVVLCTPQVVRGQLTGDRELLQRVSIQNRANRESILTWVGEADVVERMVGNIDGGKWDVTRLSKVEFAFDRAAGKYMYVRTQTDERGPKGKSLPDEDCLIAWGAIRTTDSFNRLGPYYLKRKDGSSKRPKFILAPRKEESRGDISIDFDPFRFFEIQSFDVQERLLSYYNAKSYPQPVSVLRTQNKVVVELKAARNVLNRFVFDLEQGANPVEVTSKTDDVTIVVTRIFEKQGDLWLPKKATATNTKKNGALTELAVTFTKHVVNDPMPEETFTPERLGIQKGDLVHDRRTGSEYRFDGFIDALSLPARTNWRLIVVWSCVIVVGCFAITVWQFRRFQRARVNHGQTK